MARKLEFVSAARPAIMNLVVYAVPFFIFAIVLELFLFGVVPTGLSIAGIVITCFGVALVAWRSAPARRSLP